jgi:ribosomal protein S18 acetylase RimI-like enzyme
LPEDVLGVGAREEQWRGWIGRAHATTVVARVEGAVVGFCALHSSPGEASPQKRGEIPALFVLPTYWRRGWGRRLCERALDEARASGMEDVGLWVLESNTRARSFYEALGFRLSDETRVFLERGSAELLERRYVKDLREA